MAKHLWIINEYAGSPYHGMTYRHYYLAKALIKQGYEVSIITSAYSHLLLKKPSLGDDFITEEWIDGIRYCWIKMPSYEGARSLKRVLNWFLFAAKVWWLRFRMSHKPDAILVSSLPLHPIVSGFLLAKFYGAKLLFEVRDLWPLSAMELGGYSSKHPFIWHLQWLEDFAYKHASKVISLLPHAYEYMQTRGLEKEKFIYLPNGVDTTRVGLKQEEIKGALPSLPKDAFIVGYTGTLGHANALEYLIEAARLISEPSIVIVIVGEGVEKASLMKQAEGISSILFLPSIEKSLIPQMLARFDVCYIGWRKCGLYRYGVSANKLFDYMLAQKPIVHSMDEHNDIVSEAQCGVRVDAQDPQAIAKGIMDLFALTREERAVYGKNGKAYVLEHHSYDVIAKRLAGILEC